MKKITVRQPAAPATADDWVSGGTEPQKPANTERQKSASTESRKSGKLARLTIDLPEELHGQFKAACAKRRTRMKDEVLTFIEGWTQKNS